jgi:hypothetical protein
MTGLSQPGEQSLVHAYLPLLEQWEAEEQEHEAVGKEQVHEETEEKAHEAEKQRTHEGAEEMRRPLSMWLLSACCLNRWRALVLGQWTAARVQFCLPRLRRFLCPSPRRRVHQRLWFLAWAQQRFLGTPLSGTFP